MKKLLGISLVAVLTATPLMASAADRVTLVTPEPTPNTNVASTSYVQGAYNVLGAAINAIDTDLSGNYATKEALTAETSARTEADTNTLNSAKSYADGLAVNYATAAQGTTADNAVQTVKVNGTALTEDANHDVNLTVATGTAAGTIAVNGTDISVNGVITDLTGYATETYADTVASNAQTAAAADATTKANAAEAAAKSYADGLAVNYATAAQGTKADNAETLLGNTAMGTTATTVTGAIAELKAGADAGASALQASDIATGTANGTISVDGADVAVKGLGSAAYTNSTAYDAAGAAATAEQNAKAYTDAKVLTVYTTWNTGATGTTTLSNPVANPGA